MEHAAVQSPFGEGGEEPLDGVYAWARDRPAQHTQALQDKGVGLLLHQQGLGTTSSAGKAMFQMLGVFAEFEQGIIRQRVNAGLARARANGDKLGRRREPVRRGASGLLLQRELTLHRRRLILGSFIPQKATSSDLATSRSTRKTFSA